MGPSPYADEAELISFQPEIRQGTLGTYLPIKTAALRFRAAVLRNGCTNSVTECETDCRGCEHQTSNHHHEVSSSRSPAVRLTVGAKAEFRRTTPVHATPIIVDTLLG